ncbi:MAG TPA: DUF2877 domain-containing protein [Ktedonobacteraceae bacterium]|nr:DUF2877 domain-containing protein [Ktedonobacteraceae bacterium]
MILSYNMREVNRYSQHALALCSCEGCRASRDGFSQSAFFPVEDRLLNVPSLLAIILTGLGKVSNGKRMTISRENAFVLTTQGTALARPRVSYSTCIAEAVSGPPRRGFVHSAFQSAANIIFPDGLLLSLNAATSPRMPNGIQLATITGNMPISHLRVGMPVLLGVHHLSIQLLDYTLDLSYAIQWNPYIEHPAALDLEVVRKNIAWLRENIPTGEGMTSMGMAAIRVTYHSSGDPCGRHSHSSHPHSSHSHSSHPHSSHPHSSYQPRITEMARALCGRGIGLTPSGDDMLAGWMAMGWLLNGPQADFLSMCQHIVAIARQQTHVLSQCWLEYAANGYVAEPIKSLLHALTRADEQHLVQSTQAVLALGATSGYDVIQGILMATSEL